MRCYYVYIGVITKVILKYLVLIVLYNCVHYFSKFWIFLFAYETTCLRKGKHFKSYQSLYIFNICRLTIYTYTPLRRLGSVPCEIGSADSHHSVTSISSSLHTL